MAKVKKGKDKAAQKEETVVMELPEESPRGSSVSFVPQEVVFDKLEIREHSINSKDGPLTPAQWKKILGWETESEYKIRMVRENPGTDLKQWAFGENGPPIRGTNQCQPIHCVNTDGERVVCWNNGNNRPFDENWSAFIIQMVLRGQWAGPLTCPGETVNGETVRISRYGIVLSGQHQGTALILADEILQKDRAKQAEFGSDPLYPFWNGHECPVIETIVITGLSQDERVLRTIDYVKPRSEADMLFTMELFRSNNAAERREMTRMLSAAIDLLWQRTDAKGYKTHPEVVGFLERHPKLLKCVEHLFTENTSKTSDGGRRISKLHVSAGKCSSLCYLMGSSGPNTDGDVYRNESPPTEKNLDWSLWEKARSFWARLARDRAFSPVRDKLDKVVKSDVENPANYGLGGTENEKFAIIAKAWYAFKDHPEDAGPPFSDEDLKPDGLLHLSYTDLDEKGNKLPNGEVELIDENDFLGIDCPESLGKSKSKTSAAAKAPPMPPPATRDEIEKAKEEALRRHGILSPAELLKKNQDDEIARREEQKRKLLENRAARKK